MNGVGDPDREVERGDGELERNEEALEKLRSGTYVPPNWITKQRTPTGLGRSPSINSLPEITSMNHLSCKVEGVTRVAVTPGSVLKFAAITEEVRWTKKEKAKKVGQAKLLNGSEEVHEFGNPQYDAESGNPQYDPEWAVEAIALSPDSKYLALGFDNQVKVFNLGATKGERNIKDDECHSIKIKGIVRVVTFCPESEWLAVGGENNTAAIFTKWNKWEEQPDASKWHSPYKPCFKRLKGDEEVWAISFSPNRNRLAVGGEDKKVRIHVGEAERFRKHDSATAGLVFRLKRKRPTGAHGAQGRECWNSLGKHSQR
jgi:hypothetical protein